MRPWGFFASFTWIGIRTKMVMELNFLTLTVELFLMAGAFWQMTSMKNELASSLMVASCPDFKLTLTNGAND